MNDKEKERLSLVLYDVVFSVKNTLSLPVHDTLYKSFLYALMMFGITVIATIAGYYTFISWQGSLVCSIILGVLLWIERAQNNAFERTYKVARQKIKQAQLKAQKLQSKGGKAKNEVSRMPDDDSISPE